MLEIYLEQTREPYIRKIFNENYEFDRIDFKEVSNQYQISMFSMNVGTEIENVMSNAS